MMDTVLNIGMTPEVVKAMTAGSMGRFAQDANRRLIQMFGDVVMNVDRSLFEKVLDEAKEKAGATIDAELGEEALAAVLERYKAIYKEGTGESFPEDPWDQLRPAISAVFESWNNPRAIKYRQINDIRGLEGTGVNVQMMVFGNKNPQCGTGVGFTRDPATGENRFFAEYLDFAQGEDVVAGIRTPKSIDYLNEKNPEVFAELDEIRRKLEHHYKDMQDIEFTVEEGSLYMLQTRTGKRTIFAHLRTAVEMVEEGLIEPREAVARVPSEELGKLFAPVLHPGEKAGAVEKGLRIASGLPASPGGASGRIVFTASDAEAEAAKGEHPVVLCRIETSPEDVGGMEAAEGILTARGGMTSHAAVVARGMGVPCVSGASGVSIDMAKGVLSAGGQELKEGDWISIDGFDGTVYAGKIGVDPSEIVQVLDGSIKPEASLLYRHYDTFMGWVDEFRKLGVRTNADKPRDAERAVQFGAEGIGLTRTEHMFFDNIAPFRRLILVADEVKQLRGQIEALGGDDPKKKELEGLLEKPLGQYGAALDELLPIQRRDFDGLFRALEGRPATVRLLDPPLHEFLPKDEAGQKEMAEKMGVSVEAVKARVEGLEEMNPMLGLRGCRLGLLYPEVSDMQVRAIMEAACDVKAAGIETRPEIMIPLVGHVNELRTARDRAEKVVQAVFSEKGMSRDDVPVLIGTMIEVPRAAVTADRIGEIADFFSFGTNDLTQMGCGFSRDDAGVFLGDYVEMGIYDHDPFKVLDQDGVGRLVRTAVELGRKANPKLHMGICGEHGGEPKSVKFFHEVGLDYVSCSPFRVPIARLAAAQAELASRS
jgi:pyruvate,orthophosphate dikinase